MQKEGKSSLNGNDDFEVEAREERDHCHCCHCGAGQDGLRSQNYMKMREHLQQRLREKQSNVNADQESTASSENSATKNSRDSIAELDSIVNYIEGHQTNVKSSNPKKAAKKALQRQKKMEQKLKEEQKQKQTIPSEKELIPKDQVPNGMVRITHNPVTNSAVITPLYGPLEPSPSYLQQPISHSSVSKIPIGPVGSLSVNSNRPSVQFESAMKTNVPNLTSSPIPAPSQPQQMVTIRRVMQPNLSEPVVTVTLKGETPDSDRVLFTLVNGQVIPINKTPKSPASSDIPIPHQKSETVLTDEEKKARKKKKKKEKKERQRAMKMSSVSPSNQQPIQHTPSEQVGYMPQRQPIQRNNDFSLENFRLPPGITLTRVQGSNSNHPELPMKMVSGKNDKNVSTNKSNDGSNPIIVTSPINSQRTKDHLGSLGGLSAPNVIVVDTRKIQQQQHQKPAVKMQSVAVQTGEDDIVNSMNEQLTKKQRKKLRKKAIKQEQELTQSMAALQLKSSSTQQEKNVPTTKKTAFRSSTNAVKPTSVPPPSSQKIPQAGTPHSAKSRHMKTGTDSRSNTTSSRSKKKKKQKTTAHTGEDKWEENVFVPKSDLDLERGDMDDDERELEAFKRFCFNSVPPERKEKVRIHLNVKDIFGKKSNGSLSMTCK